MSYTLNNLNKLEASLQKRIAKESYSRLPKLKCR